MKPYVPRPTTEYASYLDLPKRQYLGDYEKYPRVDGLAHTCGWFEVRRMPGDVLAVAEPMHEQNGCFYVVLGTEKALVFDTGLGIYNPRPLVEELAGDREIIVVNSHFHFDHAGGNHFFGKAFIHLDELVRRVADEGLHSENITYQVRDEAFPLGVPEGFDQMAYGTEPFEAIDVSEGMTFDLGGRSLEVFFAPGHSPDGICLIDEANDLVLAGDTFYLGALYGQFASDEFGYSDMEAYRRTMHRLSERVKDGTRIFCCHNEFMADGIKIKQAAELFDRILDGTAREGQAASSLDYGENGELREVFGDGFSIMYV